MINNIPLRLTPACVFNFQVPQPVLKSMQSSMLLLYDHVVIPRLSSFHVLAYTSQTCASELPPSWDGVRLHELLPGCSRGLWQVQAQQQLMQLQE